jgi:hypothetical protein
VYHGIVAPVLQRCINNESILERGVPLVDRDASPQIALEQR